MKRILIINADMRNASDLIRAHRVVKQFLENYSSISFGRRQFILLSRREGDAYCDHVAVWQTANQITVRFLREESKNDVVNDREKCQSATP